MRVKVLPPPDCERDFLDERSWCELPDGTTLAELLKLLRCSRIKAKLLLVSINGERVEKLSTVLHDGDVVGFFVPVSGG